MGKKNNIKQLENKAQKVQSDVQTLEKAQNQFSKAEKLVKLREAIFMEELAKEKDGKFWLTAIKQGTLTDRISALSMLV